MSFRAKLIALFAALAIVPLTAVGVIDYVRSMHAIENVIRSQTGMIAERAAHAMSDRYVTVGANLRLLAENTAAQQLIARGPAGLDRPNRAYLDSLAATLGNEMAWITYGDLAHRPMLTLEPQRLQGRTTGSTGRQYVVSLPLLDSTAQVAGYLDAGLLLDEFLPQGELDSHFGITGWSEPLDSSGQRLSAQRYPQPVDSALVSSFAHDTSAVRPFETTIASDTFIGTIARAADTPFAVLSVARLGEFAGPFNQIRSANFAMVLVTIIAAAALFILLMLRLTGTLQGLTLAAAEVGRGNLSPSLPAAGDDEIGRLAGAFGLMTTRLRTTLVEIERSRRMAAIGEFASQIAHEIRNPLTSIKLNLQKVERAASDKSPIEAVDKPVRISLREVDRLDRVVRGVLQLGRTPGEPPSEFRLSELAETVAESMRADLQRRGLEVYVRRGPDHENVVRGHRALLESAVMNLVVNAAESSSPGQTIRLETEVGGRSTRLRVTDQGPGVPLSERERIFAHFYTTKTSGSGIGLSLAHRTVEEHQGTLWVEDPTDGSRGASFIIDLPAVEEPR
jgi:signal transduction histidine kinase